MLLGALTVSCGSSVREDDNTIEVWHGFTAEETEVFREIVDEFEKDYTARTGEKLNIKLTYVSFGDMFTKLKTAALGKLTPDVAFVDSIKVTDLAFGQALVKVNELEGFKAKYGSLEEGREKFVRASYNAGVVNRLGEVDLYAMPVQTTTVALFWNRSMFRAKADALREAGLDPNRPPRDWAELEEYGTILTDEEEGVYGFGMSGSLWFNFPIYNMYDVEWVEYDETGMAQPAINSPNAAAALERISKIVHSGYEGGAWKRSALAPDAGFINNKYAMILTGPWMVESFSNAELDFDIGLIPRPTDEEIESLNLEPSEPRLVAEYGKMAYTSSNVGGQSGVIMRTCENREGAFEFIDYFISEPVQRGWASRLGQIPVRMSAWEDLDTSKFPFMTKFMDQLQFAKRIPPIPMFSILESNIYTPENDLFLQKPQDPRPMLENIEQGMEAKILQRINEAIE